MKILMLVNWKIKKLDKKPNNLQSPNYVLNNEKYWFFNHFANKNLEVKVLGMNSINIIEKFEQFILKFYLLQGFKSLFLLQKKDLIISHSMQSGIFICFLRRFFKTKRKHIVFDIGSFASASTKGLKLKLMQFASKSIDGVIYHTSSQLEYYKQYFPWLVDKSAFIRFGTDNEFFDNDFETINDEKYMICVGYSKRDWDTLIKAYKELKTDVKLLLVGKINKEYYGINGVQQIDFIPIDKLKTYIAKSMFCILPLESFNYSYGQMTLLQQMAMGKVVLAANVPSLRDYIKDGKNGVFYESKNVNDLKCKIEYLINNNEKIKEIEKEAKNFAMYECNEKIMALEIEKFIEKILKDD